MIRFGTQSNYTATYAAPNLSADLKVYVLTLNQLIESIFLHYELY